MRPDTLRALPAHALRADRLFTLLAWALGCLGMLLPVGIIFYLLVNGVQVVTWAFLTQTPAGFPLGTDGGVWPAIQGSFALVGVGFLFAFPLALLGAIHLAEYAGDGRVVRIVRFLAESLAAIPSILYGVFGYAVLVVLFGFRISLLAGGITLGLIMFPILLIGMQESIRRVDPLLREAVLASGVPRSHYIARIALWRAAPAIIAISVLAMGQAFGSAAPVMLTASVVNAFGRLSLREPVMTLPTHLYYLVTEAISFEHAFGTALVLVMALLVTNLGAMWLKRLLR